MSIKASKTAIGAFVVGAAALAVAGVMILGSGSFMSESHTYVLYFDESLNGLGTGSPVTYKGVKIGKVNDIKLRMEGAEMTPRIPVYIEIDSNRFTGPHGTAAVQKAADSEGSSDRINLMVERGLKAQLELQSILTGQLMVAFDFYPDKPKELVGMETEYPELPTIRSGFEEIARTFKKLPIEQIIDQVLSAISGIEKMVNAPEMKDSLVALSQTMEEMKQLVRNVNDQVTPLGPRILEVIEDTQKLVCKIDERITPLASSIEETLQDTRILVRNIDDKVVPLASSMGETLNDTRELVQNIDGRVKPLAASIQETTEAAGAALEQANKTLAMINGFAPEDSALVYEITNTLKTLNEAMESIRAMADYIERHPEALLKGKSGS